MRYCGGEKPSPWVSRFGLVIVAGIALLGLLAFVKNDRELFFRGFVAIWCVGLIGAVAYHLVNAFSPGAPYTSVNEGVVEPPGGRPSREKRLAELHALKERGLITEAECEKRREEILREI